MSAAPQTHSQPAAPLPATAEAPRSAVDCRALTGGIAAIVLGALAVSEGLRHPIGALSRMGPGYFPVLLGSLLAGLGIILAVSAFISRTSPRPEEILLRPVLMIPASILCFAWLAPRFGLAPAIFALILVASLSEKKFAPQAALLIAGAMTAFVWTVFSLILSMPYPLLTW